jgi:hypothetical protein
MRAITAASCAEQLSRSVDVRYNVKVTDAQTLTLLMLLQSQPMDMLRHWVGFSDQVIATGNTILLTAGSGLQCHLGAAALLLPLFACFTVCLAVDQSSDPYRLNALRILTALEAAIAAAWRRTRQPRALFTSPRATKRS